MSNFIRCICIKLIFLNIFFTYSVLLRRLFIDYSKHDVQKLNFSYFLFWNLIYSWWFSVPGYISSRQGTPGYTSCIQQFIYLLFTLYTTFHLIYYSPSLQHLIYSLFTLFTTFYLFIITLFTTFYLFSFHSVYNISFIYYSPCLQHFIYLLFTMYTIVHLFIIHPVSNILFIYYSPCIQHFIY